MSITKELSKRLARGVSLSPEQEERFLEMAQEEKFDIHDFNFTMIRMKKEYWLNKPFFEYDDIKKFATPSLDLIKIYASPEHAQKVTYAVIEYYFGANGEYKTEGFALTPTEILILSKAMNAPYNKETGTGGFPGLTIQDIKHMLYLGISGQLKKPYGKITLADVLGIDGWIDKYHKYKIIQEESLFKAQKEENIKTGNVKMIATMSKEEKPMPEWLKEKWKKERMERKKEHADKLLEARELNRNEITPISFNSMIDFVSFSEAELENEIDFFQNKWSESKGSLDLRNHIIIMEQATLYTINKIWKDENNHKLQFKEGKEAALRLLKDIKERS